MSIKATLVFWICVSLGLRYAKMAVESLMGLENSTPMAYRARLWTGWPALTSTVPLEACNRADQTA